MYCTKWGKGIPSTEEGQFYDPYSIYNYYDLIYVGDYCSVQIFWKDGMCIQRLGGKRSGNQMNHFSDVSALCIMDDQLYVSDYNNKRIQIFQIDIK